LIRGSHRDSNYKLTGVFYLLIISAGDVQVYDVEEAAAARAVSF